MDDKDLQTLLSELHDELQKTEALDDKESELLRNLEGDINKLLERSEEARGESGSDVIANLEESVGTFELTHPTLTAQIYKILELLTGSGI